MKRKLLALFIAGAMFTGINAQTLLYSNDFEDGLNGSTITGNGAIEASGNPDYGMVFHNSAGGQAIRANYLNLPSTIMSDLQLSGANALSVSFWVNKGTATNYYWSPIFSAYGAAPNPGNTWPMMVVQLRGEAQTNIAGTWCDFTGAQNVNGSNNVGTAWIDGGAWRFYTIVLTPVSLKVYVDGAVQNEWALNGTLLGASSAGVFTNGSELSYVCLGGNQAWGWNDPDPAFLYDKLKIYAGALTSSQISSLMVTGELAAPVLTVNNSALYLDDISNSATLVVNGAELSEDITITAPAGIVVNPTSISKTAATDVNVSVSFDGSTIINGSISFTSGSLSRTVTVKTSTNAAYTPAYSSGNMIADPTFSAATLALGGFSGWGPTGIVNENTYSGRGSAYIRGSCWPDGGSIDRTLSVANGNSLQPNSRYRLRAMVKAQAAADKFFQFEVEGYNGTTSIYFPIGNTNGWKQIDTTFVTGATVTTGKGIYFNSCGSSSPAISDTAFIDNYELYEIPLSTANSSVQESTQKVYVLDNSIISEFELKSNAEVTFAVYNMQGKLIQKSTKQFDSGFNRFAIDAKLTDGVYIIQLSSNEFTLRNKLII